MRCQQDEREITQFFWIVHLWCRWFLFVRLQDEHVTWWCGSSAGNFIQNYQLFLNCVILCVCVSFHHNCVFVLIIRHRYFLLFVDFVFFKDPWLLNVSLYLYNHSMVLEKEQWPNIWRNMLGGKVTVVPEYAMLVFCFFSYDLTRHSLRDLRWNWWHLPMVPSDGRNNPTARSFLFQCEWNLTGNGHNSWDVQTTSPKGEWSLTCSRLEHSSTLVMGRQLNRTRLTR